MDKYALLPHGASMGDNYGPIVVARSDGPREVEGTHDRDPWSADDGLSRAAAVREGLQARRRAVRPDRGVRPRPARPTPGLLIHEGQLTYGDNGLRKIVDLGEWWAERTGGLPLPLGGNIIRRDLGPEMIRKVSKLLHDSIAYALSHRKDAVDYAQQFGRGLDKEKTDKFVGMYVNDLTLGYGERGRKAVERLMTDAFEAGIIPRRVPVEFAG